MSSVLFDAPGPRTRRRVAVANVLTLLVLLGIVAVVGWALARNGQFAAAKWTPFLTASVWVDYLLPGLWSTLRAAAIAIVAANVFGLVFGLARLARAAVVRAVAGAVVEFFRAVPVLVLMVFFYLAFTYGGLLSGARASFWGVIVGLTLYNGAVIAELVRSGVQNLPRGQREAGLAVGLTRGQTLTSIELPQALLAMMPSMVSQLVVILKDTALGSIVAYPELLRQARLVGSSYANYLPAMLVAAVVFIVINYTLTALAERLAWRLDQRTSGRTQTLPTEQLEGAAASGVEVSSRRRAE